MSSGGSQRPSLGAALTVLGLIVAVGAMVGSWISADAARDAVEVSSKQAEVSERQVALQEREASAQTRAHLVVDERSDLGGFTYDDGRRLPESYRSPVEFNYELRSDGPTIHFALRLRNAGPGWARIQTVALARFINESQFSYLPVVIPGGRPWEVGPGELVDEGKVVTLTRLDAESAKWPAHIRAGRPFMFHVMYSDEDGRRKFSLNLRATRTSARSARWALTVQGRQPGWPKLPSAAYAR